MKILILGAGALGGYYGGLLQKGGADVTFLVRPQTAERLRKEGLRIRLQQGWYESPVKTITRKATSDIFDVIFVTCKAFDLEGAMQAIEPMVGSQTAIFPILNGIKHIDILATYFGQDHILGGVTQFLVNQDKDGSILPTFHGAGGQRTVFGEINGQESERCLTLLKIMKKNMPDTTITAKIVEELWGKFIGAGASFSVASLLQARAGRVAATEIGRRVVERVYDETMSVCAAEGYPRPEAMKINFLDNLWIKKGSDYGPSLLADIENFRKTEGEHVVGDLVKRGQKHNLEIPLLEAALCKIELYENNLK